MEQFLFTGKRHDADSVFPSSLNNVSGLIGARKNPLRILVNNPLNGDGHEPQGVRGSEQDNYYAVILLFVGNLSLTAHLLYALME